MHPKKMTKKHDFTAFNPYTMTKTELLEYIQKILSKYNLQVCGRFCGSGEQSDHVNFQLTGKKNNCIYDVDYISRRMVPTWDFSTNTAIKIATYEKIEDEELHPYISDLLDMAADFDDIIFAGIGGEIQYEISHWSIHWEVLKYISKEDEDASFYKNKSGTKEKK